MNPGIVSQYQWALAIGAAALVLFAVALFALRRLGAVPALPWSWTRATLPPDDPSLRSLLLLLLAAAAVAAALPLFAAAYVFRWFQSAKVVGLVVLALLPVAVPALIVWRAPLPAGPEAASAGPARPAAALALLLVGVAACGMIAIGYREPSPPALALLLAAGLPILATVVGAAGLVTAAGEERAARLAAMALWGACGAALVFATLAVAMTAQTLAVLLLERAQWNTSWYALGQPVAALAFLAAAALAAHPAARAGVLGGGAAGPWRRAAEAAMLLALGALFTALFLAGGAGPSLPAWVWLALKAAAVAAALALASRTVARGTRAAATRYAWLAAGLAALNLVATAIGLAVGGRAEP
jgi:NADH-quinone oxidoreductase subunit H